MTTNYQSIFIVTLRSPSPVVVILHCWVVLQAVHWQGQRRGKQNGWSEMCSLLSSMHSALSQQWMRRFDSRLGKTAACQLSYFSKKENPPIPSTFL